MCAETTMMDYLVLVYQYSLEILLAMISQLCWYGLYMKSKQGIS